MSPRYNDPEVDKILSYTPPSGAYRAGIRWWLWIVGFVLLLMVIMAPIGFATSWFGFVGNKLSPQNVEQQWTFAYDYNNSLKAIAQQACTMQIAVKAETDSQAKVQREDQLLAIQLNYSKVQAQYNAALQNAFRAKYIKPNDVPTVAPTLTEEEAAVCSPG